MDVKAQLQVLGAKFFKDVMDGTPHDFTKLRVSMPVSEKDAPTYGACGENVVEMKFGKADEYQKLKHLPFPVMAELSLKLTTDGYEVVGFKAITAQVKAAA